MSREKSNTCITKSTHHPHPPMSTSHKSLDVNRSHVVYLLIYYYIHSKWSIMYLTMMCFRTLQHMHVVWCQLFSPLTFSTGFKSLSPHDVSKHHFTSLKNKLNFPATKGFRMKISMELVYNTWQFSFIFHPLQVIFIHYKSGIATAIRGL